MDYVYIVTFEVGITNYALPTNQVYFVFNLLDLEFKFIEMELHHIYVYDFNARKAYVNSTLFL